MEESNKKKEEKRKHILDLGKTICGGLSPSHRTMGQIIYLSLLIFCIISHKYIGIHIHLRGEGWLLRKSFPDDNNNSDANVSIRRVKRYSMGRGDWQKVEAAEPAAEEEQGMGLCLALYFGFVCARSCKVVPDSNGASVVRSSGHPLLPFAVEILSTVICFINMI